MSETISAAQGTLTTQQVVELTKKLNYGTWRFQKTWNPMHIADAEGCYFTDGAGEAVSGFIGAADVRESGAQESCGDCGDCGAGGGAGVCVAGVCNRGAGAN